MSTAGTSAEVDIEALLERCRWHGEPIGWDQIIGHEPAKRELRMVAEQYRRHGVAERLGLTLVKGIAIMGPPGSGKTLLARALAGSVDRPAYILPSAEADAVLIRRVYEALADTPCILIWDEADVFLRARSRPNASEEGRTAAAFCAAIDGVTGITGPITIAMTAEREWSLDGSALRSGRLSTKVLVDLPRRDERFRLFQLYTAGIPTVGELDLHKAADRTRGSSGADIQATVLVALGLSMIEGIDALDQTYLTEAIARDGHVMEREAPTADELRLRSLHEAGHALFAALTWGSDAVISVTLNATSSADGRTTLHERFREASPLTMLHLRQLIGFSYSGWIAEEVVLGVDHVSAGGGDDLRKATALIRRLLGGLGASDIIGPIDVDGIEAGGDSDRGSDLMRATLYHVMREAGIQTRQGARALMEPHRGTIERFAAVLLAAPEMTLSGRPLTDALDAALLAAGTDEDEVGR